MKMIKMNVVKKYFDSALLTPNVGSIRSIGSISVAAFIAAVLLAPMSAHAIKKCKDEDGKWHYGDVAVRACENSKVTTLSSKGFVKAEKSAPKSEEQKEAEVIGLAQLEEERKQKEKLESEKSRILSVYESEDDIDELRESRLVAIDNNIEVHNRYIESLERHIDFDKKKLDKITNPAIKEDVESTIIENENNVKQYSKEIDALKVQRMKTLIKFDTEKSIYRELVNSSNGS